MRRVTAVECLPPKGRVHNGADTKMPPALVQMGDVQRVRAQEPSCFTAHILARNAATVETEAVADKKNIARLNRYGYSDLIACSLKILGGRLCGPARISRRDRAMAVADKGARHGVLEDRLVDRRNLLVVLGCPASQSAPEMSASGAPVLNNQMLAARESRKTHGLR